MDTESLQLATAVMAATLDGGTHKSAAGFVYTAKRYSSKIKKCKKTSKIMEFSVWPILHVRGREAFLGDSCCELLMMTRFFTSLQVWRGCWWNWRAERYTQVPGCSPHNNDLSVRSLFGDSAPLTSRLQGDCMHMGSHTIHPTNKTSPMLLRRLPSGSLMAILSS